EVLDRSRHRLGVPDRELLAALFVEHFDRELPILLLDLQTRPQNWNEELRCALVLGDRSGCLIVDQELLDLAHQGTLTPASLLHLPRVPAVDLFKPCVDLPLREAPGLGLRVDLL